MGFPIFQNEFGLKMENAFENKVKRANQPMYKPIFVVEKKLKLALQIFASGRPEKLQTLRVCNFIWRPSAKIRKAASAFFDNKNRLSIGIFLAMWMSKESRASSSNVALKENRVRSFLGSIPNADKEPSFNPLL